MITLFDYRKRSEFKFSIQQPSVCPSVQPIDLSRAPADLEHAVPVEEGNDPESAHVAPAEGLAGGAARHALQVAAVVEAVGAVTVLDLDLNLVGSVAVSAAVGNLSGKGTIDY